MTQPEGNALRRAVAEALGWRVEERPGERPYIVLTAPDGRETFLGYGNRDVDQLWQHVIQVHYIPHYDTDLNTVKNMPLPPDYSLELSIYGEGLPNAEIVIGLDVLASINHTEPATAAWQAWLMLPDDIRKAAIAAKENRDE